MNPDLAGYLAGADALHKAIDGLSREELLRLPTPRPAALASSAADLGTWSIQQTIVHLWHSDLAATHRMCRIASEDNPLLIAYDESAFVRELHYHELDIAIACELFRLNRQHTAQILARLPESAFARTGVHNQRGTVTLAQMVRMYVDHLEHHLGFIRRKREAMGR